MNTTGKTAAMLDFEIDALKRKAHAERALDAIGADENPWRKSGEALAAAEAEREALALADLGQRLVAALLERRNLRASIDAFDDERAKEQADLAEIEQSTIIQRYRHAPILATNLDVRGNFDPYARFLESNRPRPLIDSDSPSLNWPEALRFSTEERVVIQRWRALQGNEGILLTQQHNLRSALAALENSHPELQGVP